MNNYIVVYSRYTDGRHLSVSRMKADSKQDAVDKVASRESVGAVLAVARSSNGGFELRPVVAVPQPGFMVMGAKYVTQLGFPDEEA